MAKFKHGFPVSSAVMVGFLSLNNKASRQELIKLATAMLLSEELNQDINRMAQGVNADLELARSFQLPEYIDAHTVWRWRFEGLQIIREAANCFLEEIQTQPGHLEEMGARRRFSFGFQTNAVISAFESKLKKEQKLAEEVIRKGLTT